MLTLAGCSESATDVPVDDAGTLPLLVWPVPGVDGRDWVINNYVDLDLGLGRIDYMGGQKSFNGHQGTDIDVPNFRWMDDGFPVLAAAAGTVTGVQDGNYDRNTDCLGDWNVVQVSHEGGSLALYGHLKNGSVAVSVGDVVSAGEPLGVVGSSGCSTAPHLHFELRSATGAIVDPFRDSLWTSPPRYVTPLSLMDFNVQDGRITGFRNMKDPPANITAISVGATLGLGVTMAGGTVNDVVRVTVEDSHRSIIYDLDVVFDRTWRHTWWWWSAPVADMPGTWTVTFHANGTAVASHSLEVS